MVLVTLASKGQSFHYKTRTLYSMNLLCPWAQPGGLEMGWLGACCWWAGACCAPVLRPQGRVPAVWDRRPAGTGVGSGRVWQAQL